MKTKKWFWGLFFIVAGGLFLANALEVFATSINIISLMLTVFLSAIIIGSIIHFNFGGILVPLSLVGVIFSEQLGITNITPWPIIITAILLSIGLEIIFGSTYNKIYKLGIHHSDAFEEVINEADPEEVSYQVNFGSGVKYVNTDNLKKAYLKCNCGAMKVYFANTKISKNGAEIYLDISLSGVELFIPKEWDLVLEANVSLAGIEEKNSRRQKEGPKVFLKGNVSLSGVEIIYV